jgi:predicted enzyme related to lactoylglutathione lyase
MSNHPFAHIEFSAKDVKETARFYQTVFGWTVTEYPELNYTIFSSGENSPGGGFNPVSADNPPGTVMVYIGTDDLEATLNEVEANGGTVLMRSFEVAGFGWMAVFKDPSENTVSLWKAADTPAD